VLVGDHFLKSQFSVIVVSLHMSVEGIENHVRNKITMLQYKCSLLAIFPLSVPDNFLVA
jgi:hypothetical protein